MPDYLNPNLETAVRNLLHDNAEDDISAADVVQYLYDWFEVHRQ